MILQIQKLEKIKADFDGIDIHCAYLTLLNIFLSPTFNKRNNVYME